MKCPCCGDELKKLNTLHINSKTCRDQRAGGNTMTVAEFREAYSLEKPPRRVGASNRATALKAIHTLKRSLEQIDAEIDKLAAEERELAARRRELEVIRDALKGDASDAPTVGGQRSASCVNADKVQAYLDEHGTATLHEISQETGLSVTECRAACKSLGCQQMGSTFFIPDNH